MTASEDREGPVVGPEADPIVHHSDHGTRHVLTDTAISQNTVS